MSEFVKQEEDELNDISEFDEVMWRPRSELKPLFEISRSCLFRRIWSAPKALLIKVAMVCLLLKTSTLEKSLVGESISFDYLVCDTESG